MPKNKSQSDATFLRMLANEFSLHQEAISVVTEGRFTFSAAALKVIADHIEENGYPDDIKPGDVESDIRRRVYGGGI